LCLLTTPVFAATNYCTNAIGCWGMDNNNATEQDITANNEDLLEDGGSVPTSATVPSGYSGTSRDFELDDTEAIAKDDASGMDIFGADQVISFCAWVKPETITGNHYIISKFTSSSAQRSYGLFIQYNGGDERFIGIFSGDGENNSYSISDDNTVSTGTWYHVCMVSDDTNLVMYIDGDVADTDAYTAGLYNVSNPFTIGSSQNNTGTLAEHFDGLIDEVIIDDIAFTEQQVEEIMTYGIEGDQNPAAGSRRVISVH